MSAPEWRNRIIRYGSQSADQFTAHPNNPRRHPMAQREAMKGSLDTLGWIAPVIVNKNGYLIDGHERIFQALAMGDETPVPFIEVDLSEEEEALALASFDWITQMATYDADALETLLQSVDTDNAALQAMLDDMAQQNGIDLLEDEPLDDAGPQMDKGQELAERYGTAVGQVWQLGKHRLAIGDSTDRAVIDALMGGQLANLMWTDPPYNVSYVGKTEDALTIGNDSMDSTEFRAFLGKCFKAADSVLCEGAVYYIAHSDAFAYEFIGAVRDTGWTQARPPTIQWIKDSFVLGRGDYHSRSEPILYGWKSGAAHHALKDRSQDNVWEIARPKASEEHPTMKPIELVARAIGNSSNPRDLILDPFLGSGTTLIAAHQTGRICYGAEISPDYAAVCISRWETLTGQTARLDTPSAHEIAFE